MTKLEATKGTELLASIVYGRDNVGQVKAETQKGLPGEEKPTIKYDEANRITKAGTTEYKYDAANNPTWIAGAAATYDAADEINGLELTSFTYDENGERTKRNPAFSTSTTYEYNQAGELTGASKAGSFEDTYQSNGDGLRTSEAGGGASSYLAWDVAGSLPLLLNDGTNSYIYGPAGRPIEQVNNSTGAITYLHHDQQGSTRLLTGATGTVGGTCSYSPYGTPTCEGATRTPLGYDAEYTSPDTGLVYMRNRVYDPATAQFVSGDPLTAITWEPYSYAWDNPVNNTDPSGLGAVPIPIDAPEASVCLTPETIVPCAVVGAGGYVATKVVKSIVNEWAGEEPGNDEGEALVRQQAEETEQASQEPCGQESPRSLPYEGEPNSTAVQDRGNGTGKIRDYGPDGLPLRDFDFGHDHGFGDPHAHDWPEGVRGPGRPIGPNE